MIKIHQEDNKLTLLDILKCIGYIGLANIGLNVFGKIYIGIVNVFK